MMSLYVDYVSAKTRLSRKLRALGSSASGATAIEYGLIAALIAVAIVGTVTTLGTTLQNTFTSVSNKLG